MSADTASATKPASATARYQYLLLFLVVAGFAVRLIASVRDGLWLDEIWSLGMALNAKHWWEVFTVLNSTNNHVANTLWMYLLGFQDYWGWYRFPAVLCGTGVLALVGWHPVFGSLRRRLLAVFLLTVSFPMLHFSTEARGYMPAIFFAVLAYFCILQYWNTRSSRYLVGFHLSVVAGLLFHLTFVFVLGAMGAWMLWRVAHQSIAPKEKLLLLGKILLPSVLFSAGLYYFFIRTLDNEGGPESKAWPVFLETCGISLGGPDTGSWALLSVVLVVVVILGGCYLAFKKGSDEWVFRLFVLVICPLILSLIQHSGFLYYRFYVICFPFLYLMLAELLDWCWQQARWSRIAALVLLLALTCGHILRNVNFIRYGRGDYLAAVLHIASNSDHEKILVGGDHNFRIKMILFYYQRFLPPERKIEFQEWEHWPKDGVDWVIAHSLGPVMANNQATKPLWVRDGIVYQLDQTYPYYGGSSGMNWYVFRKIGKEAPSVPAPAPPSK